MGSDVTTGRLGRGWRWLGAPMVLGSAVAVLFALSWLHYREQRLLARAIFGVESVHQARAEMAEGIVHGLLGRGDAAFDATQAATLVKQAVARLRVAVAAVDASTLTRLNEAEAQVLVQVESLLRDPTPAATARLRVAWFQLESIANELDRRTHLALEGLGAELDRAYGRAMGVSIVFLALVLAGALLAGRWRKQAEHALRASRDHYEQTLSRLPLLVWSADATGALDWLGPQWVEFADTPVDRQFGQAWVEHIHPDDRETVIRTWSESVKRGTAHRVDFRLRRRDGVYRWFDTRALPLRDESGRIVKWFGTSLDVHDAREAAQALTLERERFASVAMASPGAVHCFRRFPDGHVRFEVGAERVAELYRLPVDQLVEDASIIYRCMHSDDIGRVVAAIEESAHTLANWNCEYRVRRGDGTEIWIEGRSTPVVLPDGSIAWYGVLSDVTERKRSEAALRASETRLHLVVENLAVGVVVADSEGRLLSWNREARRIHGFSENLGLPQMIADSGRLFRLSTLSGEAVEPSAWPVNRLLTERTLVDVTLRVDRPATAGWSRVFNYNGTTVEDADGRVLAFLSITDTTERIEARQASERQQRRVALLGDVSRQLVLAESPRELLGAIFGRVAQELQIDIYANYMVAGPGMLRLESAGGLTAQQLVDFAELPFGMSLCGLVAQENQPMVFANLPESTVPQAAGIAALGVRAYFGQPLRTSGGLIGTISFGAKDRDVYSDEDLGLMRAVADQVAAALERHRLLLQLSSSNARYRALLDQAADAIYLHDDDGVIIDVNEEAAGRYGVARERMIGRRVFDLNTNLDEARANSFWRALRPGETGTLELVGRRLDGRPYPIEARIGRVWVEGRHLLLALVRDITDRREAEGVIAVQNEVLEKVAVGSPLIETLDTLIRSVEKRIIGVRGSILLVRPDGGSLGLASAPSLPPEFTDPINGLLIGEGHAVCGTAAARRAPFLVDEVATHPYCVEFRELAEAHQVRACWSFAILSGEGELLGTLALYADRVGRPSEPLTKLMAAAVHAAAIAVMRDRKEQALRESEAALRLTQERLLSTLLVGGIGTFVVDFESKQTIWDSALVELYGWEWDPADGASPEPFLRRVHPADREAVARRIGETIRSPGRSGMEYRMVRPDGRVIWLATMARVDYDEKGRPLRLIGASINITERKRSELRLATQAAVSRVLAEASSVAEAAPRLLNAIGHSEGWDFGAIWLHDRVARVLRCVNTWHRDGLVVDGLLERTRTLELRVGQGAPGRVLLSGRPVFIPDVALDDNFPRAPQAIACGLRCAMAFPIVEGDQVVGVIDFLRRDYAPMEEEAQTMLASIGRQVGLFSERKRAEDEVRVQEHLLRETGMIAHVGGWDLDVLTGHGRLTDEVYRIHELDQDTDMSGEMGLSFYPGAARAAVEAALAKAINEGIPYDLELPFVSAKGTRRWVRTIGHPAFKGDRVVRLRGSLQDITERKNAEEAIRQLNAQLEQRVAERTTELQEANKELEAFSYSVSHDLRAPLRAVDGFSEALADDFGAQLPEDARRYLKLIRDGAQRMGELIDDLLTFARLSRQSLSTRPVDPTAMVRDVLALMQDELRNRLVDFRIDEMPIAQADIALFRQVWINLVSNALKYTRRRESAAIHVGSLLDASGKVTYFVRDNGTGFDMAYAHKLFGVFQRLHRAEEFEGTGVGLAIVQRVIHRHGGHVWAEAQPNVGATFYFQLGSQPPPPHE